MTTILWLAAIHEIIVLAIIFLSAARNGRLKSELRMMQINEAASEAQYANLIKKLDSYRGALAKSSHSEYVHLELQSDPAATPSPSQAGNVPRTSK